MTTLTLPVPSPAIVPAAVAPPQCNYAGFCDYCGLRGCQSIRCISIYLSTWWAVCATCGGQGSDAYGNPCDAYCVSGVEQVLPGHPEAVQPR